MITTREEIKRFLDITDSRYDLLIDQLRPAVENELFNYIDNYFKTAIYCEAETISFNSSEPSISDSESGFGNFIAGIDILVENSKYNNGIFSLSNAAADKLTIGNSDYEIKDETAGNKIIVTTLKYPLDLKLIIAKMINYHLINKDKAGIKNEKFEGYSVTYEAGGLYPREILSALDKYKRKPLLKYV